MKNIFKFTFVLFLVFVFCSRENKPTPPSDDEPEAFIMPLEIGNKWIYTNINIYDSSGIIIKSDTSEIIYEIKDTIKIDSKIYYQIIYTIGPISDSLQYSTTWWIDSNGDYWFHAIKGDNLRDMIGEPAISKKWEDWIITEEYLDSIIVTDSIKRIAEIVDKEDIVTLAGTFYNCWKINYKYKGSGVTDSVITINKYFKSNVGLVKEEYYEFRSKLSKSLINGIGGNEDRTMIKTLKEYYIN